MTPQQRLATREFFGIKLGLETMRQLVDALGHPERTFLPVIVAGTNGKGSVTAMVSRALCAAGLRVGRYTSPHLVHLRERFAVNDVDISDAHLDDALQAVFDAEDALLAGHEDLPLENVKNPAQRGNQQHEPLVGGNFAKNSSLGGP